MEEHTKLLHSPEKDSLTENQYETREAAKQASADNESEVVNIRDTYVRWVVLFLGILTSYGSYFCSDNPQPLQSQIKEIFDIQDAKFNLLYSFSTLPNIIVPFVGGIVMDSLGVRTTMIITGIITLVGQMIVTAGAAYLDFHTMIVGRCIFGVGNQTLENTLLLIIARWFMSKELAFAWGCARAVLRTSSAFNSFICPKLYSWTNELYVPFLFGVVISIFSLICVFVVVYMDRKAEQQMGDPVSGSGSSQVVISDIKNLPKIFYLMLTIGSLVYMSFIGFTNNVNSLLVSRFGFTPELAGTLIMIIYLVAAVFSPIVGLIVDRIGKRIYFIGTAVVLLFFSNLFFVFLEDRTLGYENYGAVIGFCGFGVFYGLFSTTYWTSLAVLLPKTLGTASGLVNCITSILQTIFPEILGFIHDNSLEFHSGYYLTQVAHCAVVAIIIFVVLWTYVEDMKTGERLHKVKAKIEEKEKEKEV